MISVVLSVWSCDVWTVTLIDLMHFPKIRSLRWKPTALRDLLSAHNARNETHLLVPYCCACVFSSIKQFLCEPLWYSAEFVCVCVCRPEGQNVRWSLTHTRTRAENITNEVEWWMAGHYLCLGSEKQARLDVLNISLHGKEPSLLLMKLDKAVAYSSFNTEPLSESSGISGSAPPPVTSHESDWYT